MKRRKTDGEEPQKTEDELPEFRKKREARLKKLHRRRKLIVTLVILGLIAVFAAFNWDKLAPASLADSIQGLFGEFGSGGYPLMISSGNFKNAVPIGSNIGVLTDTSVLIYSQAGTQLAQRQHGMSNPAIDAAGGKAVVYDRGGKTFKVETRFDEPFTATTSFPIITASMSLSGRLAVVTESDSYLSELMVYDTGYKNIFKWYSSKGHIITASLSPDGTKVTAVVLSAVNGSYRSSVYVFNLGKPKPISVTDIDGELLFSIQYIDNDKIAAVGKIDESVFLSDDGKKKSIYSYNGKSLKCYANSGGITALVFGTYGTGNSSTIISLSGSGKVAGTALTKYNINSIFACDGKLAALADEGVWHADASCRHAALTAATGDKIVALPFKKNVYVFGLQAVYRYQLP